MNTSLMSTMLAIRLLPYLPVGDWRETRATASDCTVAVSSLNCHMGVESVGKSIGRFITCSKRTQTDNGYYSDCHSCEKLICLHNCMCYVRVAPNFLFVVIIVCLTIYDGSLLKVTKTFKYLTNFRRCDNMCTNASTPWTNNGQQMNLQSLKIIQL